MSEEQKVLTKSVAEEFLDDPDSVDLTVYSELNDDAAEVLSGYEEELDLRGLESLTDAAALSLSKHKGELHLNGLRGLSLKAAEALGAHRGQIHVEGTARQEMNALIPSPLHPVDLGIKDPDAPNYKGATTFKIQWDLLDEPLEKAGYDIDWGSASVVCDLATGEASELEIHEGLVKEGLAIPYLNAGVYFSSAFENDRSTVYADQSGDIVIDTVDFSEYPYAEIIKAVHSRANDFFGKEPTRFPIEIGITEDRMQWNGSSIFKVFFYLGRNWTEGAVTFTYDFAKGHLLGINRYGGKCKGLDAEMTERPFSLDSCSLSAEKCVELIDSRWKSLWQSRLLGERRKESPAVNQQLYAEHVARHEDMKAAEEAFAASLTPVLDHSNWEKVEENRDTPWILDSFARLHHEGKAAASDPRSWDQLIDKKKIMSIADKARKLVDQPNGPYSLFKTR